ncbi:MAG: thioredoxin domain-containing protein, partial [Thermoanaerobaculia bacterium]
VVVAVGAIAAFAATRPPAPDPSLPALVAEEISKGPADAPVTIIEYGDFNCPSCRQYHQLGIIDQVLAQFPGEVRFVWRHFPVITPSSPDLAEAAECAADQGAFWEFHDLLFDASPTSKGQMVGFAAQLGLDTEAFSQCFESRGYRAAVEDQMKEAFGHGFRGTPSFMINDTPLAGPPTYDLLISLVEDQLN